MPIEIHPEPEQPEEPDNGADTWRVPLEFGAERGAILEHSEAQVADAAILINSHYTHPVEAGFAPEYASILTRDFHARWAVNFWG